MPVTSTGESTLVISSSSRFNGALKGNNCKISVTEGSVFDAPFTCKVHGEILLDASSRFAGDASAGNSLHIKLTNGSVMHGNTDATVILVHTAASSRYEGNISAEGQAEMKSTDGSAIAGAFAGGHIYAVSTASSRIALTGSTPVPSAVIEVASGSRFSAPALPLRNGNVVGTRRSPLHRRTAGNHLVGRYSLLQWRLPCNDEQSLRPQTGLIHGSGPHQPYRKYRIHRRHTSVPFLIGGTAYDNNFDRQ